jgi:hypothetical protein
VRLVDAVNRGVGTAVLIVAGILLALLWMLGPVSPPLYDGLQGPAGPYKYVNPPPGLGVKHSNPTSGKTVERLSHGRFTETLVTTKEHVPQALLELGDGAVIVPSGVTTVTLTVRPVTPPHPIDGGVLDGNVYLFRAEGNNGQSLSLNPKVGGLLELRKTGQELSAHMSTYRNGSWVAVSTLSFVRADYLATDAKSFGYYALIAPRHESAFLVRYLPLLIAALVILVLVITAFVAIRLTRSSRLAEGVS